MFASLPTPHDLIARNENMLDDYQGFYKNFFWSNCFHNNANRHIYLSMHHSQWLSEDIKFFEHGTYIFPKHAHFFLTLVLSDYVRTMQE